MIIGIDDSGNFDSDKLSFYASVFIRPKKYKQIKTKFILWEENLPDSVKENSEVKGKLLNEEQLIDFADKILINNGYGAIKAQAFGIEINESNKKHLITQQNRNVIQLNQQAKEVYRDQGDEYTQIATFYEQMASWLASKSLKTLYKIELLGIVIVKSLNLSIISSTLRNFDKELNKLEINIDEGITGRESVDRYWRDMMRTIFWHITYYVEPIIHIEEWRFNHPFLKRFIENPKDRSLKAMFTSEMRDLSKFYDSKDRPEIRMADIVASAYFRKYVKNENIDGAIKLFAQQRIEFGQSYVKVALAGKPILNPINPYESNIIE